MVAPLLAMLPSYLMAALLLLLSLHRETAVYTPQAVGQMPLWERLALSFYYAELAAGAAVLLLNVRWTRRRCRGATTAMACAVGGAVLLLAAALALTLVL